jgi:hypothetical protein
VNHGLSASPAVSLADFDWAAAVGMPLSFPAPVDDDEGGTVLDLDASVVDNGDEEGDHDG